MREERVKILEELANGIIPADEMDGGAACVEAARKIAERIDAGVNAKVYLGGLEYVENLKERPGTQELLGILREKVPGFFKQLRMDVAGIYLSDADQKTRPGWPWHTDTKLAGEQYESTGVAGGGGVFVEASADVDWE